ncbi:uncharacterized protein LOC114328718 isoform X3 [Diabrotica virgifera virgifera]|uniref:Uncharacterized protein LOC114328718 isoform X3 n=1 Tax=Diabrotica virgifera virgifera TaxID=50390 RepID=A0A6P7FBY5_DIAVI|nr:uncharacterized protein LOC114328718 isoform X3 [Diabrotica virgifera virgifera]
MTTYSLPNNGSVSFSVVALMFLLMFLSISWIRKKCQERRGRRTHPHQQDDIYNISGRVQNQEQWPTHDAHLSIDHISVLNQMNKPVYDDAPPSYEEVMKTSIQVVGETSTPPYSPPQPPSQVVIVVPPTTRSQ